MTLSPDVARILLLAGAMWAATATAAEVDETRRPSPDVSHAEAAAEPATRPTSDAFRRHRIELRFGYFDSVGATLRTGTGGFSQVASAGNVAGAVGYAYRFSREWALGLTAAALDSAVEVDTSAAGGSEVRSVGALLLSVRRDFPAAAGSRLRPYLSAALGPCFRSAVVGRFGGPGSEAVAQTAMLGQLGGGLDVQVNRWLVVGARAGYSLMSDFPSSIVGPRNYSGFEAGLSIGVLLGSGTRTPE